MMEEPDNNLEIPVTYRGEELCFPARMVFTGFTHKIQVDVYGQPVLFEPDEERNYRAILPEAFLNQIVKIEGDLLRAIAAVLEAVAR